MQTAALNYKLIKKIKDERFDEDLIHQYQLLINIGFRDLQIGVVDDQENRMLLLEDYVFPSQASPDELLQILDQLFDAHAFLRAAFWKGIKVSIKNNKYVQVPEALFLEEAKSEYLRFNAYVEDDEEVESILNPKTKAVTVFAMSSALKKWLQGLYPNAKLVLMHQSAVLIETLTNYSTYKKDNSLYIYVDRFKLHIMSCRNGSLLYYNQFAIKQFSDYIRYIMLVLKSLNLSQQNSQVVLWGYIGKNSPHYNEFYKYINNVVFGHRPKFLTFGYMFDEVQDHHFFDLYGMQLLHGKK
ncbi:MAG TPA: DUF3822 family protein [Sphingobacteriaceae bacterium]